jgi:hypothetical protein
MTEVLQEYADSRGVTLRVDRAAGVLRGVKLIGLQSLNGRRYLPAALTAAVGLYEGAKVNVNHPKDGPLAPRDYRDRLGVVRQVEFRADEGLFANLHFNPKHPLAEQLAWDAEHNPQNVGFSHNVVARLAREGAASIVEQITHVQSVDLVADPASTRGLFEQQQPQEASAAELAPLATQLAEAQAREAALRRNLAIHEACVLHGWPPAAGRTLREALGAAFHDALVAAENQSQVERLIVERIEALRAASGCRPRSREPLAALEGRTSRGSGAAEFARAIRGRG